MRFVISPAKTLNLTKNPTWKDKEPHFYQKSLSIREGILKLSKKQIGIRFKIKSKLLDETYHQYHHSIESGHALMSYNGLVYKHLDVQSLSKESLDYLKDHILILDAMYGVLRANDTIEFYRLDFNVKLNKNLYDYWDIKPFVETDTIINLASKEYEKMLKGMTYITIDFKEATGNSYITKATYAKMARGQFLRACATNQINSLNEIKKITFDGYKFNDLLSNNNHYIYTRKSR